MAETGEKRWLRKRLDEFGEQVFIHSGEGTFTYCDLGARVDYYEDELKRCGIGPGSVVALQAGYSLQSVALFLALHQLGAIVAPVTDMPQEEVDQRLEEAAVEFIVHPANGSFSLGEFERPEKPPLLAQLAEEGASGLILFSSGSTGRPKVMVHNLDRFMEHFRSKRAKRLSILVFLLFDHIGGLNTMLNILATGAIMVVPRKLDAEEVATLIAQYGVQVLPASPTFLNLLLMSGAWKEHDLSSLRIISYGTEPMPEALLKRLKEAFPKTKFIQTFGTSETGISHVSGRADSTVIKLDDPQTEYKVVDGELLLRSQTQILGYLNAGRERFTEDGWFRTGDMVEEAGDGYLRIVGRQTEVINVGGEKVLPGEVEQVILEVPEVGDCTVRGEANAITGQHVLAEITVQGGADISTVKRAVRRVCRERLARYKVPARVVVKDQLAVSGRFKKVRS